MSVGLIYLACLTLGLGYAIWTGLLGPLFGGDGGGHDVGGDVDVGDPGHVDVGEFLDFSGDHDIHVGEVHLSPMSPNVLATFLGSFGALGVIGHYALHLAWWRSLLLACSSAVIIAGIFYYVIKSLYSVTEASSEARVSELIGETAVITVEITVGGTGEIVYSALGTRYQAPARPVDSERGYARGEKVIIKRIEGGIYYVAEE